MNKIKPITTKTTLARHRDDSTLLKNLLFSRRRAALGEPRTAADRIGNTVNALLSDIFAALQSLSVRLK